MRLLVAALLCASAWAAGPTLNGTAMGYVFGTSGGLGGTASSASQTQVTVPHTVAAGARAYLVVAVGGLGNGYPTSMTYNSTPLTKLLDCANYNCQIWGLTHPAPGTHNIVLNFATMTQSFYTNELQAATFYGVDQRNPIDASFVSGAAVSATLTTNYDNDALFAVATMHNGTFTALNSQTILNNLPNTVAASSVFAYKLSVAKGSNTVGWSHTGDTGNLGIAMVALKPFTQQMAGGAVQGSLPTLKDPLVSSIEFMTTNYPSAGGDTQEFTGWTASGTCAGPFNGGCVIGQYNDGIWQGQGSNKNLSLLKITNYDPVTIANTTIVVLNDMSSYGGLATNCMGAAGTSWKSRDPWSLAGKLYLDLYCYNNSTFTSYGAFRIVSPDGGLHWCNWKTYQAGSNTCTSSNWQAAGDVPVDAAGFQWPGSNPTTDTTNKMARQVLFQTCQEQTLNCPAIPSVDTSYIYFSSSDGLGTHWYISRGLKASGDPMNPAWQVGYNAGVWDANMQNMTDVAPAVPNSFGPSIMWVPDFQRFLAIIHGVGAASPSSMALAQLPWGPWTATTSLSYAAANGSGFPSWTLALLRHDADGNVIVMKSANQAIGGQNLDLSEVNLGPGRISVISR